MRVGLIVNPIAGMGGSVGLKGTDGDAYTKALELGAIRMSHFAAKRALSSIRPDIEFTSARYMGSDVLDYLSIPHEVIDTASKDTCGSDTKKIAKMMEKNCDLIMFCGGDGTARDILDAVGTSVPVLGIPAGVKMYSSVFATTPEDVANIVHGFATGYVKVTGRDVMDINEEDHRNGILSAKFYGCLNVPYLPTAVQDCKGIYEGNNENEEIDEVAEYIVSTMEDDTLYVIGPGSTAGRIMERIGLDHTLLGIDAVFGGTAVGTNLNEKGLLDLVGRYERTVLILGIIGKQGFFLGRGNKELTPAVIRKIGADNIVLVSGLTKLNDLKELHVDTGDPQLDQELKGYRKVVFRYARERLVKVT
ncbi:MAG: ATP-NAD kinase family protein [Methanomassiliicoccaceae archaeon]|nr:ATP-NAD kinase family protein [Methanomassiliicoccaceae archaeon]